MKKQPKTLHNLIDYICKQNPRGVLALGNSYGELPYNYRSPIGQHLKKVCLNVVRTQGVEALFEIHPDKSLFEQLLVCDTQATDLIPPPTPTPEKESSSSSEKEAQPTLPTSYKHFKRVPLSPYEPSPNFYTDQFSENFFGSQDEPDKGSNVALWLTSVVILLMLSFFLMHLFKK